VNKQDSVIPALDAIFKLLQRSATDDQKSEEVGYLEAIMYPN
jgi:hypothetical protein